MTLAEMRRQANIIINSLTEEQTTLPNPILTRYINRGYRLLNNLAIFNLKSLSLSTTSGTRTVAAPVDFMYSRDVLYNGKRVTPVPYEWLDLVTVTTGAPTKYSIRNETFYFDPIPSTTGSTITGWYYGSVTALSAATDEPATTLPSEYHDYLIDYAVYEGLLSMGSLEAAKTYKERFDEGVQLVSAAFRKDSAREDIALFRAQATPFDKSNQ